MFFHPHQQSHKYCFKKQGESSRSKLGVLLGWAGVVVVALICLQGKTVLTLEFVLIKLQALAWYNS